MSPVVIISQAVATGGLTGARPVLTLFLIQLYAYFVENTALPQGLDWILNPYTVGVLGALTVVEHFIRTDPDFEQMMKIPNNVVSTGVALMSAFLLVNMGYDPEAMGQDAETTASLFSGAVYGAGAGAEDGHGGVMTASMIVAVVASLGLSFLRGKVIDTFEALAVPSKWWRWIEAGGVAGLLTIIILMPFAALFLAILMVVVSAVVGGVIWSVQRAHEKRHRRPCPECDAQIRVEATLCPACGEQVEPQSLLAEPTPALQT